HPTGPCGRRAGAGRRLPGGGPCGAGRSGDRLRLLRPDGPQAVRPDRHRRPVRQGRGAGGAAALSGGRRDDRRGREGPHHLCRPATS
ncbi:hypothetical protein LTR94_037586, partial [Friedmanniomyces endolithicus]